MLQLQMILQNYLKLVLDCATFKVENPFVTFKKDFQFGLRIT